MINDERVLHIDLAQNILQSRLVQIYCSNKFHQHHCQRKSLSLFSLTFPSRAQEIQKKKKLARFRWLAGLRFIEVSINAYLQQDREVFPLSSPSPALPRISFFTPFRARKRRKKKERERERGREIQKKANDRAQQQSKRLVIATLRRIVPFTHHRSKRERERNRRKKSPERARGIRSSRTFFLFFYGGVFCIFFRVFL